MRIPRTNFYNAATGYADDFETESESPAFPPLAELDDPAGDAWQSAFKLAPNVRFTRTPESEIVRRRTPLSQSKTSDEHAPDDGAYQDSREAPGDASPLAALAAEVQSRLGAGLAERAPVAQEPAVRLETATRPANGEDLRDVTHAPHDSLSACEEKRPVTAMPFEMVSGFGEGGEGRAARPATRLDHVSDFAFWECVALEGDAALPPWRGEPSPAPAPMRAPVPALPAALPAFRAAPDSIATMYRVVECRSRYEARNGVAAPVAPPPLPPAPPVAETQPVTPAAVAAPAPAERNGHARSGPPRESVSPPGATAVQPRAIAISHPRPSAALGLPPAALPRAGRQPVPPGNPDEYEFPPRTLLQEPVARSGVIMTQETLEQNAGLLENVLEDFGIRGEIIHVRPGPVVTLYEFEPAPGVKSSRVIGLADDIARSMSALSARVAVIPGRNVIGIELPNSTRETVYFRELIDSQDFGRTGFKLALCLGKTIGGEPVIAELAKMPHLLVAGTTGSGKSVAINTMILSLLYRLKPEECRLIMVDPKMLELSVYDGIPHLLTPVVTDPKKAVMALKWAVREMEERYRKMSRLGVRNIDGYNARAAVARDKGETVMCTVPAGFDKGTGEPLHSQEEMDLAPMPYIVVIVDEMADLMMVAGKEIEGAIQRLAQMARAAGIHLIMATQRPSVDVITGTIKANFPTRISFQVTSKIDSRTILGEQGAEQLLGQGDMLHMMGGGRIARVHGPFVSDEEVEKVVAHLKSQGRPEYLDTVTADEEEDDEPEEAVFDKGAMAAADDSDALYAQAVKVVLRDKKCSTSYIQRRLQIGYNRAASLVERMEKEGLVGPANHVGKREIVSGTRESAPLAAADAVDDED